MAGFSLSRLFALLIAACFMLRGIQKPLIGWLEVLFLSFGISRPPIRVYTISSISVRKTKKYQFRGSDMGLQLSRNRKDVMCLFDCFSTWVGKAVPRTWRCASAWYMQLGCFFFISA